MLKTLQNMFKVKDIRKKLLYTFMMLVVIRIGSQLPIPGVNRTYFADWFDQTKSTGDAFSFFNAITGGSFEDMSIFALSITPYITSSIIMQLMTIVIPKLEEWHKDGEDGRKKIASITRYVTVILAFVEAFAFAVGFGRSGLLQEYNFFNVAVAIVTMTAGSAMLMWIGEQITEKGVGNGISIVLLINIISRLPQDISTLFEQFVFGKKPGAATIGVVVILAVILFTTVFVIVLQGGERRIPVQYAKKAQGGRMVGGQNTFIPLKINTAGVVPIIFASSIFQMPIVIATLAGKGQGTGIGSQILAAMNSGNWFNINKPVYSIGLVVYIILVVAFAYFYTSITFNPLEVANNIKRQNGCIPGIRSGKPTSDYLTKILNYIVFIGACGLILVQIIPFFCNGVFGASVSFGGTSLIIIASVILETMKQIESQMRVRYYKGFLSD